jgi:peptide/nickel transport system substrate-binding protein
VRLKPILAAASISALASLSGCGEAPPETPPSGGTAVIGVGRGATTLLPPLAAAALDFELSGSLFLALNFAEWADGELRYPESHPMALAHSWEYSADGAALTYHMDSRHRWSDGTPVRAADVVFTYRLLQDPELGLPLSSTAARMDSVLALDDSTVTFFFDAPYPGMLFDTGIGIIPSHVYESIPAEELIGLPRVQERGASSLIVSGPFKLDRWQPADQIVLTRNPTSLTPALLDRVVVRIIPEEATRIAELRSGGLDVAQLGSYREATLLAADSDVRLERSPQRGFDYIAWNPATVPAFADRSVRAALSLSIDRATIIEALDMVGFAEPAFGPYGSLFAELETDPPGGSAYDPEAARQLLASAGWTDSDGDGIREKEGIPLRFRLATEAGNERREAAAQIIRAQLAEVGAEAQVRTQEFGSLLDRLLQRDYEAVLLGWQVGLDPDISFFWYDPDSPFNVVGFDQRAVRSSIDSARAQPTAAAAIPHWKRAGDLVAAEYPYAFLWFFDLIVAVGPRLGGVAPDAVGFLHGLTEWHLASVESSDSGM